MSGIQAFLNGHKPKSTPGVVDLALKKTDLNAGIALDLCCGTGVLAAKASARGLRTVGVDLATQFIGKADGAAGGFVVADVGATLPFRSNSVQIVYFIDSLQYFTDPDAVLREITRLLRPGGVLILSTQNNYNLTGVKRLFLERLTGKTWSPWLVHPIENHITYPWLIRTLKRHGYEIDYVRGLQFVTAWVSLLPSFVRHWSPWAGKPWRSLASLAQRIRLPAAIEESILARFAMIVFVRARKTDGTLPSEFSL